MVRHQNKRGEKTACPTVVLMYIQPFSTWKILAWVPLFERSEKPLESLRGTSTVTQVQVLLIHQGNCGTKKQYIYPEGVNDTIELVQIATNDKPEKEEDLLQEHQLTELLEKYRDVFKKRERIRDEWIN